MPPAAPSLAVRVRAPAAAAALPRGHHRSTFDGADVRREKPAAAGSQRSAPAGAAGAASSFSSPSSPSSGSNKSRGFATRRQAAAARPHSQSGEGDSAGSDEEGATPHRHTFSGSSGTSRLGRLATAAAPAAALAPARSQLGRPSPTGGSRRPVLPAPPHPASHTAISPLTLPPEHSAAAAAGGAARYTLAAGRSASARAPACRDDAAAVGPATGQLASKLMAGLQLHALAGSPSLSKAGVGQWLSDALSSGSSSGGGGRAGHPPSRASVQHGST